ncbi:sigma-54-dependent transcriptional regulator [Yunchengibacter salinarum]|uniref:sigma-54-dependent transcriptional regulator n=1 Tax=Yunchengibacter salinarum TaxID=3133399 RepID=UPI0035B584EC
MSQRRVLIVEDEATQRTLLTAVVEKAGYLAETVPDGAAAIDRLNDAHSPQVDVMLLDLVMPGMDGIAVLKSIQPHLARLPVVMLTARSSVATVVDAMRAGASDFIVKPASAERIRGALRAALETETLMGDIAPMVPEDSPHGFDGLVGDSPPMRRAKAMARKAAASSIPVLLDGESGVGKEVFAKAIHEAGRRAAGPFVAVNCGAIPENLVESILFGHEKGAFTGATERRIGRFQEASGGTLFLDEVGELPLDVQVKLLRALQEKRVDPLGARASVPVDIRVISATNRDLAGLVDEGGFREDLYYRLNVFPVTLPPLRERREDIPALTHALLSRISEVEDLPLKRLSSAALALLEGYDWPGNIRQLQNVLFRAVILSGGDRLEPADFPHIPRPEDATPAEADGHVPARSPALKGADAAPLTTPIREGGFFDDAGHVCRLADIEARAIRAALIRYEGRMSEAARRLDIGRSTLYRKVARYGLEHLAAGGGGEAS